MRWLFGLSPALLLALPAPAPDSEAPFDFIHNQIFIRATLDGQGPFDFLLDSGTRTTTVDLALARKLGLSLGVANSRSVGAGGGRVFGRRTAVDELTVGGLTARHLPVVALDLSGISAVLARPLGGVIGFDLLASRVVQIDYFSRRVRFYTTSPPVRDRARRIAFPMRFLPESVLPVFADCIVNGTRIPITIDTGSSLGLILFPAAIDRLGLGELARQGMPLEAKGYRGAARLRKGWVRSVALGAIDLGAIEVVYVEKGYGDREPLERRGGSLGNAALQDFTLTLDYPGRTVTLEAVDDG